MCAAAILALTACSGGDDGGSGDDGPPPEEVLTAAKTTLDETTGLNIRLTTPGLPEGVTGVAGATGVVTNAPAFEGDIEVVLAGTTFKVPVVSVKGKVWAELPGTTVFQDIDPADYNAPDPAGFITGETGFPSLLPATTDVAEGKSVRGGEGNKEVLTTYTGTVPGDVMKNVIPSAAGDSFEATYQIANDEQLREATFVGVFYPDSEEMTYTVSFDDYGTEKAITKP
jgi:lipoprotein LprG